MKKIKPPMLIANYNGNSPKSFEIWKTIRQWKWLA